MTLTASPSKISTLQNNPTESNENLPEYLGVKTMKEMQLLILSTQMSGLPFLPKLTTQDNYTTNIQ